MKLKGNLRNSRGTNGKIEFWGNQSQRGIRTTTHVGGNQGGAGGGTKGKKRPLHSVAFHTTLQLSGSSHTDSF